MKLINADKYKKDIEHYRNTICYQRNVTMDDCMRILDKQEDMLKKIKSEIIAKHLKNIEHDDFTSGYSIALEEAVSIIDKYREEENEKNKKRFENELVMMQTNIFSYKGEQE